MSIQVTFDCPDMQAPVVFEDVTPMPVPVVFENVTPVPVPGPRGKSAYEVACDNGYEGTEAEWLASLQGKPGAPGQPGNPGNNGLSAYQIAQQNGYEGTEAEWLASLQGKPGDPGQPGNPGNNGLSAYQIALQNGYEGTEAEWLASLQGKPGNPGQPGNPGNNGLSAYQIALQNGFEGTEAEWLASLQGKPGNPGQPGERGASVWRITTAPSAYTTEAGGFTPAYRIALSTVLSQAGASDVRVGDTILRNYYTYPVGYVDASYVYLGKYASIRGSAGTPGVSVSSVEQTTASSADGGSNVVTVTLSDGTTSTFTVQNGSKGSPGDTPQRGKDYWTPTDQQEIEAYIATELAKRNQLTPEYAESVEWLSENGDQSKLYVLPDGMIYAWMLAEKEVESGAGYTNKLPLAADTDRKTIYGASEGTPGYQKGQRLSSSGSTASHEKAYATGFIPVKEGDVVRIKGIKGASGVSCYIISYDSANTKLQYKNMPTETVFIEEWAANGVGTLGHFEYDAESHAVKTTITSAIYGSGVDAIRFSCGYIDANSIVTVNEAIVEGGTEIITEEAWASTGHAFVPADYEERFVAVEKTAMNHTARIIALEKGVASGGDNTIEAAYTRMKNWKYPIHEDAPVFLLEENKPAIPSSDWTTAAIYAKYDALMVSNSHYITKVNCGVASDGTTPIYAYHFSEPTPHYNAAVWSETKATILVCSGVHPTEQSGVWSMYYAMEEITNNKKLLDLRRNVHFIIMPMINPTGFTDSTYGVRNPDGIQVHYNFEVDFKYPSDGGYVAHGNRNHGGETPLSIPETQYFDALMNEHKDTLACVLSCHNNDVDTHWGTGFIWSSCATHFMCNLGFRLADKMSAAWREKHGAAFDEGVRWANNYALTKMAEGSSIFTAAKEQAEWDYRVGMASISGSGGTEYKQALKYGVHGINVEVCDRCMILDRDFNQKRTSNVTTMGCETYVNFFRTFMAIYDHKDKKDYAPNLPWTE